MSRQLAGSAAAIALTALLFFGVQPRVTPLWGLYVLDRNVADREVLFLDPFPNAASCAAAARAVGTSGQWTRCRARLSLSFFQPAQLLAFEKEFAPGGLWEREIALCGLNGNSKQAGALQTALRNGR